MNAGIISSRYAKALLEYVRESGSGSDVYVQACTLVRVMNALPQMKEYVVNQTDVTVERKVSLMSAALSAPVEPAIVRFLQMVTGHHRVEYFPRMLLSFIEQYRQAQNIKVGSLVTAVHDEGLGGRLETLFHDRTGAEVHLEEKVNPDIIGGFVFELDGYRLDASVESRLERLRRQLIEKNNRIV